MGGLTAAGAMAARPELFFGGLIYSPAVWFANHAVIADVQRSKAIAKHRIVLYQGSRGEGEGKDEGEKTEALYHALVNKGLVEGKSIFRIVDEHGQHTEAAWRKQLPYGLSLLFPPR